MTGRRGGRGSATVLERRYRRWLLAYPADYRRERGDELVGTLLDLAGSGRRRPRPLDVLDLVACGLARRVAHAWGPARRSRSASVLSLLLAGAAVEYLLWLSTGPAVCFAPGAAGDPVVTRCPGPEPLILEPLGYAWLLGVVLLAGLPLLGGGRRIATLAACLLTVACAPAMPDLGLLLGPSLVAAWCAAATVPTGPVVVPSAGAA